MKHRSALESAVLRTLLYASVFDAGIRRQDVERLLISPQVFSHSHTEKTLKTLIAKKTIHQEGDWVWVGKRISAITFTKRQTESEKKKKHLHSLLPLFVWLPTIKGIAITGSVAVGNAKQSEDIDLMIVTSAGFLWATRALVEGILLLCGVLRTRGMRNVRNKLCLNLWLDEKSLSFSTHSLYVARELAQAIWVVDRKGVQTHTLAANPWTAGFVSALCRKKDLSYKKQNQKSNFAFLFFPLEYCFFLLQASHMRARTREVVSLHVAFFHPRDTQADVLGTYLRLCRRFQIDSLVRE